MESETMLKACPFCGSQAEEGTDQKWGSFVFCTDEERCNALQHGFMSEADAIDRWNTRTEPSTITEEGLVERVADVLWPLQEWDGERRLAVEAARAALAASGHTALLSQIGVLRDALEQVDLLSSNYGGWFENGAWEWGQMMGDAARAALSRPLP